MRHFVNSILFLLLAMYQTANAQPRTVVSISIQTSTDSKFTDWANDLKQRIEKRQDVLPPGTVQLLIGLKSSPYGDVAIFVKGSRGIIEQRKIIAWWMQDGTEEALRYIYHAMRFTLGENIADLPLPQHRLQVTHH